MPCINSFKKNNFQLEKEYAKIDYIFNIVYTIAVWIRLKDKKANGKSIWNEIKEILIPFDSIKVEWVSYKPTATNSSLYKNIINQGDPGESNETRHFLYKTVSIPLNEEPTIRKLMQLAFNIGQLIGSKETLENWMYIDNYMNKENRSILANSIPDKLVETIEQLFKK